MKHASCLCLTLVFLCAVNVKQSISIPRVPEGYQKYQPYDPVPIDESRTHFNTAGQLKTGTLFADGYLELVTKTDRQ